MTRKCLGGLRIQVLPDEYFHSAQQFAQFRRTVAALDGITNRLAAGSESLRHKIQGLLANPQKSVRAGRRSRRLGWIGRRKTGRHRCLQRRDVVAQLDQALAQEVVQNGFQFTNADEGTQRVDGFLTVDHDQDPALQRVHSTASCSNLCPARVCFDVSRSWMHHCWIGFLPRHDYAFFICGHNAPA